ncbi:HesA/MoeB/ThiF family protein [Halovulum sp. GXIMD14793]
MSLTPEELDRYARHIVLREIGGPGQMKLKAAKVAVVGAGGLGCPALTYLAAAGVGHLSVIDDDTVSLSNLQRQILHATSRIGMAKTESAALALAEVNPHVKVTQHQTRLSEANADLLAGHDLILDGSDSFATRYLVNATATRLKIPLIAAAMSQWEGQISLYDPSNGTPCYACIFPEAPADGLAPSCAEAGIMGALAGVMGSMMAGEAIKHLTNTGTRLSGRMLIFDALYGESRVVGMKAREGCLVCDGKR